MWACLGCVRVCVGFVRMCVWIVCVCVSELCCTFCTFCRTFAQVSRYCRRPWCYAWKGGRNTTSRFLRGTLARASDVRSRSSLRSTVRRWVVVLIFGVVICWVVWYGVGGVIILCRGCFYVGWFWCGMGDVSLVHLCRSTIGDFWFDSFEVMARWLQSHLAYQRPPQDFAGVLCQSYASKRQACFTQAAFTCTPRSF